ncbi:cadherin repeat domain-containing protein [Reichenbachiella versicolor]|uniref:hypothetical protein n=1 Tax=Reichenbachiella versicolor TaxID=1821036 RepID=UPI000D6E6CF9|nr:hypothetical protein [Reichenbachiella versicolor]
MKKYDKILAYFMSVLMIVFTVSCDDSDDSSDIGGGDEGIKVADGYYIAKAGEDPVSASKLVVEQVEDDGFGAQERIGFAANYVYLTAGDYNIVQIFNQAVEQTFGGTAGTGDNASADCPDATGEYPVIAGELDGAAFNIASEGLYKVTFDQTTKEIIPYKINQVGVIGSATPNGWGGSTNFDGSVSADGGKWTGTNVLMVKGEWKIRFNCNWNIDRRIDAEAGFGADNGYMLFTNFGGVDGDYTNLAPGNVGANMPVNAAGDGGVEEAYFTVDITWSAEDGFKVELTKTADYTPAAWSPNDYAWALTGSATPNGWPTADASFEDHDMFYEAAMTEHTWTMFDGVSAGGGTIELTAGNAFKFRANDKWDDALGYDDVTVAGDTGNISKDGDGNFEVGVTKTYEVKLFTDDEGETYTATFTAVVE